MTYNKIENYGDYTEVLVSQILDNLGVRYIHESQDKKQNLDFYLPDLDIYIEVKRFHSVRYKKQISCVENLILIQGVVGIKKIHSIIYSKVEDKAFNFIKQNKDLLNISEIERQCDLKRTSLLNAVNRNQKSFRQSDKLVPVYLRLVSYDCL